MIWRCIQIGRETLSENLSFGALGWKEPIGILAMHTDGMWQLSASQLQLPINASIFLRFQQIPFS